MRLFLCLGYRKIGFVTLPLRDNDRSEERRRGYFAALKELGLPADPSLVLEAPGGFSEGADALVRLIQTHPGLDAAFFAGDVLAVGALFECQRRGWAVPGRVAIASFDDLDIGRLRRLLESCFGRTLAPDYFGSKNCHRVYVTEDYRATAILTAEAGLVYLDKFAVTRKAQGEGLGTSVWSRMRRENDKLFWRSQTSNEVNAWYFQQAEGAYRTPKWTVFWYGMNGFEEIERCVKTALALPATLKDHGVEIE